MICFIGGVDHRPCRCALDDLEEALGSLRISHSCERPCAKLAQESSASLLFFVPRRSRRQPYSDALLPTILTAPLRTFAVISMTLIVRWASNSPGVPGSFRTFWVADEVLRVAVAGAYVPSGSFRGFQPRLSGPMGPSAPVGPWLPVGPVLPCGPVLPAGP